MSDPMDEQIKGRIRLWLRSEKAMGLGYVAACEVIEPIPTAPAPSPTPARPTRPAAPVVPLPPAAAQAAPPAPAQAAAFLSTQPFMSRDGKLRALDELNRAAVRDCRKCVLHERRTHTVFGEGDPDAQILFIGEGPGETEDLTGRPFVGKAGNLLDKMIAGMGLRRDQVFIANIVKCRPPGNREPAPDEVSACIPTLIRQIEIIRPKVIVTLGRPAAHHLLDNKTPITRLRGTWQEWRGIKVMPTFHPSYVLRVYTPAIRGQVWSDLQKVMAELGMPVAKKGL